MRKSGVRNLLPLNPKTFHVLLALASGEQHGYAIAKSVEAETDGMIRLTPGTLYPLIRQMLVDGWIVEIDGNDGDPRRRPYRLSALGKRIAQAEALRMDELVRLAHSHNLLTTAGHA
ncbi:MAG: helix-turn-helix transcriptional regulator [Candidatus Eremiobacteraeota bacterium]|nr:helix-turn-helix transcriptional regulator [Candidatus Eremiobacteraeota bacterium]